jgi:hypothetical protein
MIDIGLEWREGERKGEREKGRIGEWSIQSLI